MIKEIKFLTQLKDTHQYTQAELAQILGVSTMTVSNWFTGKNKPTPKTREKINNFLHSIWTPGIVEVPESEVWGGPCCLHVWNINDPYNTVVDLNWTGNEPSDWGKMITCWKKYPYRVRATYNTDYPQWRLQMAIDVVTYNCTLEHLHHEAWDWRKCRPDEVAWDVIEDYNAGRYPEFPPRIYE